MMRMTRALVALVLLTAAFCAQASLWFGDDDGLHRVDTNTNRTDLGIDTGEPVSLAMHSVDGSVWVLTRSRISRYSAAGTRLFRASLDNLVDSMGDGKSLALNPADGSVWVSGERRLIHLSAGGSLLSVVHIAPSDMAVGQDGTLWVLMSSDDELRRYANQGAYLGRVNLTGSARRARMLALDDGRGIVWLAGEDQLVQLDAAAPTRTLRTITVPEDVRDLALDPQTGQLWVLGQQSFFGYSSAGSRFITSRLWDDGIHSPDVLAFDPGTQSLWIGHEHGLTRFDRTGRRVATLRTRDEVETVAVSRAPVNILPTLALVSPASGAVVTNPRPTIAFQYGATCSGAPCAFPPSYFSSFSLSALLNGAAVGSQFLFDPATGQTRFVPPSPLPQGPNQVTATASDSFGHTSASVTGQFTVDSVAPTFVGVTPASGAALTVSPVTIQGSTNDAAARVRLSGVAAEQGSTFSFTVPLALGVNSFTLTATDAAGNAATQPLTYTYNPPNLPPVVSITAPADGATFIAPASFAVNATASDPDGTIARVDFFSNGAPAGTDASSPYATSLSSLANGTYSLTAVATDNRGGTTTSAPVRVTVGPANAAPTVTLTQPAGGATFAEPATIALAATASDSDGSVARVEFLRNGVVVATLTSAPYEFTLTGVPAGTYGFAARATDDRNAATTSATASVTVNAGPPNVPPTVALTRPANGAAFTAPAVINLAATAADSDGTVARVEFLRGGVVVATVASPPYETTLTGVAAGTYAFAARAVDDRGGTTTSGSATVSVGSLALAIASPAPGEVVDAEGIVVTGSFQGPPGAAVTVNGAAATVSGNSFVAALPPVDPGTVTITAAVTAPEGQALQRSVTVTASATPFPLEVVVEPAVGFAPLAVTFTITNRTPAPLTFMFDTFGPFDLPGLAGASLSLTYPAGAFTATVTAIGASGTTSRRRFAIESINRVALDQSLRAIWAGMNNALVAGDRDKALSYLTTSARQKYGPIFDILLPDMASIVATYSPPRRMALTPRSGEYAINRTIDGVNRIFIVEFLREDGAWRLDGM